MSSIRIVKGYPISLLITVKNDDVAVNVNDSTWTNTVELRYQTKTGAKPFDLTVGTSGSQLTVDIDNTQTPQLDHLGTGYVLLIKCIKNDGTVTIQNEIPVTVTDVL